MDEITRREPRLPTIGGYAYLAWSHILLIIATSVLGAVAGYVVQSRQLVMYNASASVELPDVPTYVDVLPEDPKPSRTTIDTTAQLVFSAPVFNRVGRLTGMTSQEVNDALSVSAYPLSRVLIITFTAETPELAIAGADEAADALVDLRARVLIGGHLRLANQLRGQLIAYRREVLRTVKPSFSSLTLRLSEQIAQIGQLQQQSGNQAARVVDGAFPAIRVKAHRELGLTSGFVLGLVVGVVIAWWRQMERDGDDVVGAP